MSNDVYGYLLPANSVTSESLAKQMKLCARKRGIGVARLRSDEVYGLPSALMPDEAAVCFRISDSLVKTTASYLVDMVDYEADIGLPRSGYERLGRLISWIEDMVGYATVVVAMSDDNEVAEVSRLCVSDLNSRLRQDFEDYAPPNRVYVVSRGRGRNTQPDPD